MSWQGCARVRSIPGTLSTGTGRILGRHDGIINFTVGQRRGLDIGNAGDGERLYVLALEAATNRVVVGPREALARRSVALEDINWLGPDKGPAEGTAITAKIRSTASPLAATLHRGGRLLRLDNPEYGIAGGQAAVFYEGSRVLGGGWISKDQPPAG